MLRVAPPTYPRPLRIARVTPDEGEQLERSFAAIKRSLELLRQAPPSTHLGKRTGPLPSSEPAKPDAPPR